MMPFKMRALMLRLLLPLSLLVAGAAVAQRATFDGSVGLLNLPAVKVGSATYLNVQLGLVNPTNFTFLLRSATPQVPAGPADISFDLGSGLLTIPDVAVGSASYSATLRLTDAATYTFVLASATLNPQAEPLSQIQAQVFTPLCTGCHNGSSGSLPGVMNLSDGQSFANLVCVTALEGAGLLRVSPGDPNNSFLIRKLEGAAGIAGRRMPLGGPFLDDATIARIKSWISGGAQNN